MINVLIVEDDPMVADINTNYVNKVEGFNVIGWEKNGKDALSFIEKNKVDLIILDVYMPKMNGIELLEKLRREYNEIDIIFVTAAKEKNIIDRGLKLGAVDYLIKPFKYDRIRLALENYSNRFHFLNNLNELEQSDIDELFDLKVNNELPKGIHSQTLELIRESILKSDYVVSILIVSSELGISTVTVRHYFEYLVQIKELIKELEYGSVGRPNYIYHK